MIPESRELFPGLQEASVKIGILNAADRNCLFDAIINNDKGRACYKTKIQESSKQLRIRSITKTQQEINSLTFIKTNTTEAEWNTLKNFQSAADVYSR